VCVREWHGAPGATEARNEIVAFPADGSAEPTVLVGGERGPDFVMSPRVSPDSSKLAWIQWHHPNMPWDDTELWVADLDLGSVVATPTVANAMLIRDAAESDDDHEFRPGRSWMQPTWVAANDQLWVMTDPYERSVGSRRLEDGSWERDAEERGAHWGLHAYKWLEDEWRWVNHVFAPGEAGEPPWVFGQSSYCITKASPPHPTSVINKHGAVSGRLVWHEQGVDRLGSFTTDYRDFHRTSDHTSITGITADHEGRVAAIAASFTSEPEIVLLRGDGDDVEVTQRPARDLGIDGDAWYSVPEHITFPTTPDADGSDAVAHALFYPPKNPDHHGSADHAPPLIVMSHGGPTSAARSQLNLAVQFWTSRGFAVVDVNYRGSTGYGRAYREALNDRWGIADVDDCIAAARHLAREGRVDGERLAIRGGSAGGFTTLCALTFHDDFTAGASLYGVADLEALAKDTHKFESRYLDSLVGPYPEAKAVYEQRSPIHHTDRLATPLIILQGLEDEVVPPSQAEMMVAALRAKGVPFAYVPFEGEQHGFRQAPNIRRALEAELYFYARIFGFDLVDDIEPITIELR
jgi:dipeptidyl aminopeptidase/acylaminoacyl peptidase